MSSRCRLPARAARVGVCLLLFGCAVGPDFAPPAPPAVNSYTAGPLPAQTASAAVADGEAQRFVRGLDIPGQWWALFHSPALNALVEEAIAANPTLPAAQAALRQAWENVYAEQGSLFPTVTAEFSPTATRLRRVRSLRWLLAATPITASTPAR